MTGRVVSATDGKPVAGASVRARWGWGRTSAFAAESDASGEFRVLVPESYLRAGNTFELDATADGYAPWRATLPRER